MRSSAASPRRRGPVAPWRCGTHWSGPRIRPPTRRRGPVASNQPDTRAPGPRGDGWEGFPVRGTYADGVAWIVKIVADALHYAHGQQTFHRDVKPANVLLTVQHGPQLLDFNLAESPHSASQAQAAMHGGTLPYMAPEQIEAFLDPELWGKVGAQADVYSLGLVLREFLTGQAPDLPAETLAPARAMRVLLDRRPLLDVSVRRTNPAIPHALEAIVAKSLSVSTDERYCAAAALAEDLDRFLKRLPLVHAVNPSRHERCANWGYRNRSRITTIAACLLPVAFALGLAADRAITNRRPSGPIESTPAFLAARKSLDDRHPGRSIDPLTRLSEQYPTSFLPKLYLSFAYDANDDREYAERYFSAALGVPNARRDLIAWTSNDPRVLERLDHFVDRRVDRGEDIRKNEDIEEGEQKQRSKEPYKLAKDALLIAREIRDAHGLETSSDSGADEYKLALIEQELEEYDSVLQHADRAVASVSTRPTESGETTEKLEKRLATRKQLGELLCNWRRLRRGPSRCWPTNRAGRGRRTVGGKRSRTCGSLQGNFSFAVSW